MSQLIKTRLDPISRIFPPGSRLLPLYRYSRSEDWMLITPDSSYFGGIQSWTYRDFDFLFPWSKTRDAKDANLFPAADTGAQAHGQRGQGPSVNTEKGSEKVSKHCTAS